MRLIPSRLALLALLSVFSLLGTPAFAADFSTLIGKHVVGYQGWFGCPTDPLHRGWSHWFRGGQPPGPATLTFDLWPDVSELGPDELCPTGLKSPSGGDAPVFSAANPKTVLRHFQWMKTYGIDGAAVERFVTEIANPASAVRPTTVLRNIRAAAEAEQRGFFVMYDLSGAPAEQVVALVEKDWLSLADGEKLTASPSYMRHRGKPVVALWGPGFTHVPITADGALALQRFFKDHGVTVMGGVPTDWRTLTADARPEPAWTAVYRGYDILSPWTVGRFADPAGAAGFERTVMAPDMAAAKAAGQDYMPVVFPGFSWRNLTQGKSPSDQIPRLCGAFYQAQVKGALAAGATMLYTAMFDEVDEGTAMFKVVEDPAKLPPGANLTAPDHGTCGGGSDHYLRLAGAATKALEAAASTPRTPAPRP